MKFKFKEYGKSIKVSSKALSHKFKILSYQRYRKRGRPRNSDYEYLTIPELIERAKSIYWKNIGKVFNEAFTS